MNSVVILGFGKIGSIKAKIYTHLGLEVLAIDPDKNALNRAKDLGYTTYRSWRSYIANNGIAPLLYDISSPTHTHFNLIKEIVTEYPVANILVEKPVVNNIKDCDALELLLQNHPSCRILVNENYILSSTTQYIKALLDQHNLQVEKVFCEFSKNRVPDVNSGRFIDTKLGAMGIELTHQISLLEELGLHFDKPIFASQDDMQLPNGEILGEQGGSFIRYLTKEGAWVNLYQSLIGDIHLSEKHFINHSNNAEDLPYRVIKISCSNETTIYGQYEPIPNFERFTSRVVLEKQDKVAQEVTLNDNSLINTLSQVIEYFQQNTKCTSPLSVRAGIRTVRNLLESKRITECNRPDLNFFKIYPEPKLNFAYC